ncbi:MAG TPA: hypothetical protein VFY29_15800 [Terriglobia bacterium]|nr:hypothetical protein [Terriglobia bacterium]
MKVRSFASFAATVLVVAAVVGSLAVMGQGPSAGTAIPRSVDGKPDFSGIWQVLDNSIDANIEPHEASYGVRGGPGAIVDPTDGKLPYLPAALAKREENYKNRAMDPVSQCFSPGVPRLVYVPYPFQITQTPKWMVITSEFVNNYRNVYINDSEHLKGIDFYMGDSRGKWEGDTLVIDVANFRHQPDEVQTWFDASGNWHSNKLHVVERWKMVSPNVINFRATVEDPEVFSRPWTMEVTIYRHLEKNFRLMDYQCQIFKENLVRSGKGPAFRVVSD